MHTTLVSLLLAVAALGVGSAFGATQAIDQPQAQTAADRAALRQFKEMNRELQAIRRAVEGVRTEVQDVETNVRWLCHKATTAPIGSDVDPCSKY